MKGAGKAIGGYSPHFPVWIERYTPIQIGQHALAASRLRTSRIIRETVVGPLIEINCPAGVSFGWQSSFDYLERDAHEVAKNEDAKSVVFEWPRSRLKELPMMAKARACDMKCVVVIDDDDDTRDYLSGLLQVAQDFRCAGCFATANEALMHIPQARPDLVSMDIRLPDVNGIECMKRLKQMMPEMKFVIVTGVQDTNSIEQSLREGADAYLTKPVTAGQFLTTLKFAAATRRVQPKPARTVPTSLSAASSSLMHLLTAREQQVMSDLADGLLYKEIAEHLGISYSAVHKHQQKIFLKFSVGNRSEAIRKWRDFGGE